MYRLAVLLLILIFSQKLVCAFSILPVEQQQSSPVTQIPQNAECHDIPSCNKRISDLEAEIKKLKGASTAANKSRISSLARSLSRSKSTLTQLEGRKGETQGRDAVPNKRGSELPIVNPSAPPLTPQNFLDFLASVNIEKEGIITEQTKKTGEVYILKTAAVGIIEIMYDKTVKPGSPFSLRVSVTPRDIIEENFLQGISKVPITCYIKPEFKSKKSKVEYDFYESDNEAPERQLESGKKITWVWNVTPPNGFDSETANLYVYAKFNMADHESNWQRVSNSEIEFKESRFDGIYTFLFNNLTNLLYLSGSLFALFAAVKSYRAAKLGTDLNALRLESEKQQRQLNQTQKKLEEAQVIKNSLHIGPNAKRRRWGRKFLVLPKLITFLIALAFKWHREQESRD